MWWEPRVLYNNTNNKHTCKRSHADTHTSINAHASNWTGEFWGQVSEKKKNQSGGVFEANVSKQMGQRNECCQMFLCLRKGWQILVSDAEVLSNAIGHRGITLLLKYQTGFFIIPSINFLDVNIYHFFSMNYRIPRLKSRKFTHHWVSGVYESSPSPIQTVIHVNKCSVTCLTSSCTPPSGI